MIPEDMAEKAKLERLGYTSILEMLGERFHAAPDYLRSLNQGATFAGGDEVEVPNTRLTPAAVEAGAVRVVVSREAGTLTVDRAGAVLFFAPVTSGSEHDPLPVGDWKVTGVARDPSYSYNPDRFWDADATDAKATIPCGAEQPRRRRLDRPRQAQLRAAWHARAAGDRSRRLARLRPPDQLGRNDRR
jgi:hypothetical protein